MRPGNCRSALAVIAASFLVLTVSSSASAAANPTKLSMSCTPRQLAPGVAAACVAAVTDTGPVATHKPPTGKVSFVVQPEGAGVFDPVDGCFLEQSGAFSSKCTVSYTPTAIAGGSHTIFGTYEGDDEHGRATSQLEVGVSPSNDELENATPLSLPAKVTGTTEGATWNWADDPDLCSDAYAPVWYSVTPTKAARIALRLTVRGRVDAVVAAFRQERSKLARVDHGCALTDASGVAGISFDGERGARYLVAVAAPWDARTGGFTLEAAAVPPVKFPGPPLSRNADVRLDPLLRPGAAFSTMLREGVTYRIGASARSGCVHLALLRRTARSAEEVARKSEGCGGYLVYTPGLRDGGVFPLVVSIDQGAPMSVHVALRRTQADDLAPGLPLRSGRTQRGHLDARDADVFDIYRFQMSKRADATLSLLGSVQADLLLLSEDGSKLACACGGGTRERVVRRLDPGTYFAAIRGRPGATGAYDITLRVRTPTSTSVRLVTAGAGQRITLLAKVSPAANGRVTFEIERFDPIAGWQFVRGIERRLASGRAVAAFTPTQGRWRVRAHYGQTLAWSASVSGWAETTAR